MPLNAGPKPAERTGRADAEALRRENAELRARLLEAEDTLRALGNGEIDAIVVGEDVFTLESAQAAANRFRSDVLAQMEDAVIAVDVQGHVIYLNPAAERLYGSSASRSLGLPRDRLYRQQWLAPTDEAAAAQALDEAGFWRGRNRHITNEGRIRLVESTLSRLHDGTGALTGWLSVIRDVSEQAAAETALRESRSRLQFTLEAARIGDWELDLQTDTARRSLRHDRCFGYSEPLADWGFEVFMAHVHPQDRQRVERLFRQAIDERGEWHFECRVIWPDESLHWIEAHGNVLEVEGEPRHMLGIVFDATERKRAEEALLDADQRKDEFLATLAHELRNPLAPISNSVQIMRRSREPQVHDRAQAMIERQLAQMVHLVDDLLDVSRISQGKMALRRQLIDIATVLQTAIDTSQPLIERQRHELVLQLPEQTVLVDADMTRLTQVVSNLLNNAAKFTPEGGLVTLSATIEGATVAITVTDTGIGIPAPMLPRVFDMFTQVNRTLERSQGGLGIGLALVKRLVEMHGGSVEARSAGENCGTSVVVRLPAVVDPQAANGMQQPGGMHAAATGGCRVLVVDDNRDSADSLVMTLQLEGHETATAYDGEEAVRQAESFRPQAALLDIGLPVINGYEAARRIRSQPWGQGIVLVALTGWGQDEDHKRSRDAGFDHHLVKPVDLPRLAGLLAQACETASPAPAAQ